WAKIEPDKLTSPIAKFMAAGVQQALRERMAAGPGDLLLFLADRREVVLQALGRLRRHIAEKAGLGGYSPGRFEIAWILDFPSFSWDKEENRWAANHHPFTDPRDEDLDKLESDPGTVLAKVYDLVITGYEIGGGSIRIHRPEVQARVFQVLGM